MTSQPAAAPAPARRRWTAHKAILAACALLADVLAAGWLDGRAELAATAILAAAGAAGVYAIPNRPRRP